MTIHRHVHSGPRIDTEQEATGEVPAWCEHLKIDTSGIRESLISETTWAVTPEDSAKVAEMLADLSLLGRRPLAEEQPVSREDLVSEEINDITYAMTMGQIIAAVRDAV